MRAPSIKSMRRVLVGVILLTLGALLINYLQTWYRRSRQVTKAPQILEPEMKRAAQDVEYSEYRGTPRVVRFKIHAQRLRETQAGKNLLEGIEACDFSPDGSIRNQIRSQRADYDPERKLADFFGDVRLLISQKTEIRMDSLHYDLNSGLGSSPDLLQFESEQMQGTARGIRFDQKQQSLALDKDVDLTLLQQLQPKGKSAAPRKMRATAVRAYCSEITNRILLEGNARIDYDPQTLSGEKIEAVFDPVEKHIRSLTASQNAAYESRDSEGTRTLGGDQLVFTINESGAMEKISLAGQAFFGQKSSSEEQDLRGGQIDVDFDAGEIPTQFQARTAVSFRMKREKEQILLSGHQLDARFASGTKFLETILVRKNIEAREQAKMSVESPDTGRSQLLADEIRINMRMAEGHSVLDKLRAEGSVLYTSMSMGSRGGKSEPVRSIWASRLEMTQARAGDFLESGTATGNVVITEASENTVGSPQMKRLEADRSLFEFFPTGNALKKLDAEGHVRIAYEKKGSGKSPSVDQFRTSSDHMTAAFDMQSDKSAPKSIVQWGNFTYHDALRSASSGRCAYEGANGVLMLTESPKISDETKATTGDRMEYDQNRKVLSVFGRVRSVLGAANGKGSFLGSSASSSPGIVMADEMRYWTEVGRVRYSRNVHAQSENQNLTAEVLEISDGLDRVDAQGSVRHLLSAKEAANSSAKDKGMKVQPAADSPTMVQSSSMTYSKAKNRISYSGKVTLHSKEMDLSSDTLDAVPDPDGKNIQQATAHGDVVMQMGERICKGDTAQYYADSGKVIVTGNPAQVFDPAKGRSSGRRLTSSTADDTILLE